LPKPISEYELRNLLCLQPLVHRLKQARYDAITARYVKRPVRRGDPASIVPLLQGRRVVATVAYEDPEAIEWQSRLIRRFVPGPVYVVGDNSHDDDAALAIEAVARREGRAYLRLPLNPWRGPSASRSHGLAMNWLWRNLIRPAEPLAFGFIDDDLFPTGPDDPFAPLARQPAFGSVRYAGRRWFLWAGFCFFDFAAVRRHRLDFGQDWFAGLDTGGGNWRSLYRYLDLAGLEFRIPKNEPILPDLPADQCSIARVGPWLHECGTQDRPDLSPRKRAAVREVIAPLLASTDRS
jgi:hypothetical protein